MKESIRLPITFVGLAVVVGGLVFAYREMRKERDMDGTAETQVAADSRVERDKDGTPVLKLDADTQQRLGLQTALPAAGVVDRQVTATARVLDGGPLTGQLNDIWAAQTALDAARLDYERKKRLFDNGQNASAAAVEVADALVKQSNVTLEAARDRLAATWGTKIAAREDLKALARSLLEREAALVRVELLATAKLASEPRTVRLVRQNGDELATAHVLGPALTTDSVVIGQAFLALVATNAMPMVPGSSIIAQFDTGVRDSGMVLPRDAVVRHSGQGWVYVAIGPQTFTRRPVALEHPHPEGWLVPGQWTQPIVISGAQSLLSEELKGSIQMSD